VSAGKKLRSRTDAPATDPAIGTWGGAARLCDLGDAPARQ